MANNFNKFQEAMTKALDKLGDVENMEVFGLVAADMIRTRTRLGSSVRGDGEAKTPLKPLSDSYKAFRAGKIAFFTKAGIVRSYVPDHGPELSSFTTPTKSNLTLTGQMLDSLNITSVARNEVKIEPSGVRKDGKNTNAEVAGYCAEQGRPFNFLSNVEKKRMQEMIAQRLQEILKNELTK